MEKKVVLFSESYQFLKITKSSLEAYQVEVLDCITTLNQAKKYISDRECLFVVQTTSNNKVSGENLIKFFSDGIANWIFVGESSSLNFLAITKGAMSHLILKKAPSSTEYKVFIKNLVIKIRNSFEISKILNSKMKDDGENKSYKKIIAIGASTGGTEAIQEVLLGFDADIPPIVIVVHMPPGFTRMYAARLEEYCKMRVKEAKDGDVLKYGVAYIAPGGYHTRLFKEDGEIVISCKKEEKINGHIPSVDVFFESIAEKIAPNVVATILTGMGNDGALGLLRIKNKGGFTIGQDKATSVVYGMPRVAKDVGALCKQAPLSEISKIIVDNL